MTEKWMWRFWAVTILASGCSLSCRDGDATRSTVRYLALGDSYTIGEGVADSARWPVQLVAALRAHEVVIDDPEIVARTGWTTDELLAAVAEADPQGPFDLVTLLVGVNNQYRCWGTATFTTDLRTLVERSIALAGGRPERVILVSIPDWGVTPFAEGRDRARIAAEIDGFNQICRQRALDAGCRWVDVTPLSRRAAEDRTLLAPDGLHPSGSMYAQWVELILPEARAALGSPEP